MSLSDAGIQALIGTTSGLLGALVGAGITYWAAKVQYRTEYAYKKWDVQRAVLVELMRNQALIYNDLDLSLPSWLARCHTRGNLSRSNIQSFISQARRYHHAIYDALFAELIATAFGSELMLYYHRLKGLNDLTKNSGAFDVANDFGEYVLALANSVLAGDELIEALTKELRKSPVQAWGRNLDTKEFEESRSRYRFGAELAKYDLQVIETYLAHGTRPSYFPEILAKSDRDRFKPFVAAARAAC